MNFGIALRQHRMQAGLSLADLAKLVHYSKGHLSRVELGLKTPTPELARGCEAVLGCPGALTDLVPEQPRRGPRSRVAGTAVEPRPYGLDGPAELSDPATGAPLWPLAGESGGGAQEADVASMRHAFDGLRGLGQRVSPALLMPHIGSSTRLLLTIAAGATGRLRDAALVLAARYAEYAGWMAQETGDNRGAEWWTDQAVAFAMAAGDSDLVVYAWVRKALIALYQRDPSTTVELASRVQLERCGPRVRALAAQREAQGHAIAGEYAQARRALDRAATLLSEVDPNDPGPVIGTTSVADPVEMTTGWCMVDLARPDLAVPILRRELDRVPPQALRARARYGARLALALVSGGEPEQACVAMQPVLHAYAQVRSTTVRTDLTDVARGMAHWRSHAQVAMLMPQLAAALRLPVAR